MEISSVLLPPKGKWGDLFLSVAGRSFGMQMRGWVGGGWFDKRGGVGKNGRRVEIVFAFDFCFWNLAAGAGDGGAADGRRRQPGESSRATLFSFFLLLFCRFFLLSRPHFFACVAGSFFFCCFRGTAADFTPSGQIGIRRRKSFLFATVFCFVFGSLGFVLFFCIPCVSSWWRSPFDRIGTNWQRWS